MPKISISYVQKNGSTNFGKRVVHSDNVPRVGELIRDTEKVTRFDHVMVLSVVHEVVDDSLVVHIVAQESQSSHRAAELANSGWLPKEGADNPYTDEDLAIHSDLERVQEPS